MTKMDITRQVLRRSVRMGILYVVIGVGLGLFLSGTFSSIPNSVTSQGVDLSSLRLLIVPLGAMVSVLITTPVFYLFVLDKNAGVLEYLLAVGMGQRDIFNGYFRAALLLSLAASVPAILLNLALSGSNIGITVEAGGLALLLGLADVAFVTVLMTAFSSMQRKPTGMNSPLGIAVGAFAVLPLFFLNAIGSAVIGSGIIWIDLAVTIALFVTAGFLLLQINRLIMREKLLP